MEIEFDQAAEHKPDADHDRKNAPGAGAGAEQEHLGGLGESGHRQHARIKLRAKQQQQQRTAGAADVEHHVPDFARLDALDDRQDERADRAHAGAFGRRADAEPDGSEHAGDQQDHQQRAEQQGAERLLVDWRRIAGAALTSAPTAPVAKGRRLSPTSSGFRMAAITT